MRQLEDFILRVFLADMGSDTSFTLSFTLVPIPLCKLCDLSNVSRARSKEMSRDHKEINII